MPFPTTPGPARGIGWSAEAKRFAGVPCVKLKFDSESTTTLLALRTWKETDDLMFAGVPVPELSRMFRVAFDEQP
jgi:hypothetical protein